MKPPKCKICGHEHWNNEPHIGLTKPKALAKAKAAVKPKGNKHGRA